MRKIILYLAFLLSYFVPDTGNCQNIIPTGNEIVLPQFVVTGAISNFRLHSVFLLKLTGLTPNTTYRYIAGASTNAALGITATAPGNMYVINNTANGFGYFAGYTSAKGVNGTLLDGDVWNTSGNRYGELTTDASGNYTGWFSIIPTNNVAFQPGNSIYIYVQLNNGANGTTLTSHYRTSSTVSVVDYSTDGGSMWGSVLGGKSFASSENIVLLYDNTTAAGRPVCATYTENDGIPQDWSSYYVANINGFTGRWATVIPNSNPNGIQRIELRNIANSLLDSVIQPSGIYGTVNTVNPNWGSVLSTSSFIDSVHAPLPVELSVFSVTVSGTDVRLSWTTIQEINNAGFDVERRSNEQDWIMLGSLQGQGTSNQVHTYSFEDRNLVSGVYSYRLKQTDYNGNFTYYNLNNEVIIGIPDKVALKQNYPNPFNPVTSIHFSLPFDGQIRLAVYDLTGKKVSELVNEYKQAGSYTLNFNGANLASGIYYYVLTGNNFKEMKKMMLIK